jgi:hypothetical protein
LAGIEGASDIQKGTHIKALARDPTRTSRGDVAGTWSVSVCVGQAAKVRSVQMLEARPFALPTPTLLAPALPTSLMGPR